MKNCAERGPKREAGSRVHHHLSTACVSTVHPLRIHHASATRPPRIRHASAAHPPRIWTRTALRVKELPGNDLLEHVDVRGEMVLVGLDAQRCRVPQRMPLDQPTLVPEGRVYARGVESMG